MPDQQPHIHFSRDEFESRKRQLLKELELRKLDGLLIFRQETMYWLTGFDTFGYVFFQCLMLGSDGKLTLLTRKPDLRQALFTSIIKDIRVWKDSEHANPAVDLRDILREAGFSGKKLGIEWDSYGLTALNGRRVDEALHDFCTLEDASQVVSRLRLVKSETELQYVRRAGELADLALDATIKATKPGAWEGDISAALHSAVFANDGDYPANENVIGSGRSAFMGRYFTGRRHLDMNDELNIELAGVYRRYHAVIQRVIRVGKPVPRQIELHNVGVEALQACHTACKVGQPLGDIFKAFDRVVTASKYPFGGAKDLGRAFSTGYSLGATFAPNWMDFPLLYGDNTILIEENMVLFIHSVLRDDERGFNAIPGETIIVKADGVERLSKHPWNLPIVY